MHRYYPARKGLYGWWPLGVVGIGFISSPGGGMVGGAGFPYGPGGGMGGGAGLPYGQSPGVYSPTGIPVPGETSGGPPQGAPHTPPPAFIPAKPAASGVGAEAVDPNRIAGCLNRFVYIWQTNGDAYWLYVSFVGKYSISGFRWNGAWRSFGIDLRWIGEYLCY